MNVQDFNRITQLWNRKANEFSFIYKMGILTEKILNRNFFGTVAFIIFSIYLFFYEIQKIFELLILIFNLNSAVNSTSTRLIKYLNYICIEYYIKTYYSLFEVKILSLIIILIEIILAISFILALIFISEKKIDQKKPNFFIYVLINVANLIMVNFNYSLIYINLFIISFYANNEISDYLDYVILIFNTTSLVIFSIFSLFFIYFFNDISPRNNKLFISVSNPIINIIMFMKIYLFNLIIIVFYNFPQHILYTIVITYYFVIFFILYKEIYIINFYYYCIFTIGNFFTFFVFISFTIFETLDSSLINPTRNELSLFYPFVISAILSMSSFLYLSDYRIKIFAEKKIENLSDIGLKIEKVSIYFFLHKDKLTQKDIFKHKNLCSLFPLEQDNCICQNIIDKDIYNDRIDREIRLKTLLILSKLSEKNNLFYLLYLNLLLESNDFSDSVVSFFLSFQFKKLELFTSQLIIRTVLKMIEYYEDSHFKNTTINNFNPRILGDLLQYEKIFSDFIKNIKTGFDCAKEFWELTSEGKTNLEKFYEKGLSLATLTIDISKDFGQMQKIYKNKVYVLKIYLSFVNFVLNDSEYAEILLNIVKENLQIKNNIGSFSTNFFEKEFGVVIISGEQGCLSNIVKANTFAIQLLSTTKNFNLKSRNLHYLIPFPMNLFHSQLMRYKLDISKLNLERTIFLIKENGDLLFLSSIVIPIISLKGTLNFILLFYRTNEENSKNVLKAITDINGSIFGLTENFKSEFNINWHVDFYGNMNYFNRFSFYHDEKTLKNHKAIDSLIDKEESELIFPKIYDIFEETRSIFPEFEKKRRLSIGKNRRNSIYDNFGNLPNKLISKILNLEINMNSPNLDLKNNESNRSDFQNSIKSNFLHVENFKAKKLNIETDLEKFALIPKEICFTPASPTNDGMNLVRFKSSMGIIDEKIPKKISKKENKTIFMELTRKKTSWERYELKITKNNSILGEFPYYLFEVKKKLNNKPRLSKEWVNKIDSITSKSRNQLEYESSSVVSSLISSRGNNLSNTYSFNDKFRLTNVLVYHQNQVYNDYSNLPKIMKKLFYFFVFIFICVISLSLIQVIYHVFEIYGYQRNYFILNDFLNLRFQFLVTIINVRRLMNIRAGIEGNSYKFFTDKSFYLENSLDIDLNELIRISSAISVTDLSNYKEIHELVTLPNINLFFLKKGYMRSNQTYNMFTAMDIYISQIHALVYTHKKFNISEIFYTEDKYNITREPTKNEIILDFISYNFYQNFLIYLKKISNAIMEDTITQFNSSRRMFIYISLTLGSIFILIFILLFFVVNNIYNIHNFIITKYKSLGEKNFKNNIEKLENLRIMFENLSENNENLINISRKKKKNFDTIIPKESDVPKDFSKGYILNTEKSQKKLIEATTSKRESIPYFEEVLNTETKLINDFKYKTKTVAKKEIKHPQKNIGFYIYIYVKCCIFFLSFSYTVILESIAHPYIISLFNSVYNFKYSANFKAEVDYMLFNSYGFSIINNRSVLIDNQDMFLYYNNMFYQSEAEFNSLQNEDSKYFKILKDKLRIYYSENFCEYFHQIYPNLYQLNITQKDCQSTKFIRGIQLYLIDQKNYLNNNYLTFKNTKHLSLNDLINYFKKDDYMFYALTMGYYIKGYFQDIMSTFNTVFLQICDYIRFCYFFFFSFFITHFIIFLYYIFKYLFKKIFFYFEKLRIVISILPNSMIDSKEMRRFLNNYY